MYTVEMKRAFKSLEDHCPKGFSVEIVDNNDFITLRVDPDNLSNLAYDDQVSAAQYVIRVKEALEDNGAIVLLVRTPTKLKK